VDFLSLPPLFFVLPEQDLQKPAKAIFHVPVGRVTLGRIMNVIGEPIDHRGNLRPGCSSIAYGEA
ncbi:hypothetical protein SOVF_200570, partial [Spinacia oleracea]